MEQQKTLWGHPRGLYVLFFTELWERFSFYGMRAIFVLYLTTKTDELNAGLGWDNVSALQLYGWYTFLVYAMAVPGGLLADRLLGQKKTVLLGGLLLVAGHSLLAINDLTYFYAGLALIVSGVGALKPNISSMVGSLYRRGDIRRDAAFTIFYVGINIGAFTAPILVGLVGEVYNWHYGFGLAGIGMAIGQIVYVLGLPYLKKVGNFSKKEVQTNEHNTTSFTKEEKDRIIVLLLSFLVVIVFWMAYEQAGGLINLYTEQKMDRHILGIEIPTSFLQSLTALYVIMLGGLIARFWTKWTRSGRESSALFKMGTGTIITGSGFLLLAGAALQAASAADGKASVYWLFGAYFLHVVGELSISPVALSFITKMAPARYVSFMMGAYFLATGLANKFASMIGESAQQAGELTVFLGLFGFCLLIGVLLILLVKKLKRLTHGAEEVIPAE